MIVVILVQGWCGWSWVSRFGKGVVRLFIEPHSSVVVIRIEFRFRLMLWFDGVELWFMIFTSNCCVSVHSLLKSLVRLTVRVVGSIMVCVSLIRLDIVPRYLTFFVFMHEPSTNIYIIRTI